VFKMERKELEKTAWQFRVKPERAYLCTVAHFERC
jgi:hypothetical protein